jgi:hypothetical protein
MNRFIKYVFVGVGGTLLFLRIIFMIQNYLAGDSGWYMPTLVELQGWFFLLCFGLIILVIFIIIRVIHKLKVKLKEREEKKDKKRQEEDLIEIEKAW